VFLSSVPIRLVEVRGAERDKSLTFCKWAGICSNAVDEHEDENMSEGNTDPDTAAGCCSTAGNTSYKSRHL